MHRRRVSTHAPARGATRPVPLRCPLCAVSTHAPARGATAGKGGFEELVDVSTHAPARGATCCCCCLICRCRMFQLTRPRGARRTAVPVSFSGLMFQLTRPRGARPLQGNLLGFRTDVSTHAPARGATRMPWDELAPERVSTHAPARGATRLLLGRPRGCSGFNSRAREGRDSRAP